MFNQLLKLFVWNSLTHLCLSASISTAPSTTPACFPGSSYVNDCMSYTCDENGQWQEFEFTRTDECCLKSYHPACGEWGTTSSEFIVTTESPPTTTSTPMCVSGSTKAEDCRIFFCQDGQWQGFEFTATRECCLQTFHPKCQAMGFTSTGQATDVTSTEFIVTTESAPTTTSTPLCESGSMKSEDCRMFFCQDGQWQVGEFTATRECCLQTFHPKCQAMGFTSTGQATDVTSTEFIVTTESPLTTTSTPLCDSGSTKAEDCMIFFCQDGQWQGFEFTATRECCLQTFHPKCQSMGFTSTGQATDVTSTEFIVTTESPPTTTSTPLCESGSMKSEDCRMFFCQDEQWQVGEFTATRECCLQTFHPKCQAMGFTSTGQATDVTSTEFIVTTESPPTTTSTPLCESGSIKSEDCRIFICQDGQWLVGEFTATRECCLQTFHPRCQATDVTSKEFMVTTEAPPTTQSTHVCDSGSTKAEDCMIFYCQDGQWQGFEFTATKECCLQTFHPKCQAMGFTSTEYIVTTETTTTTQSTHVCDSGSTKAEDCIIFFCQDGQWQGFEFTATKECCLQTFHPKCQAMGFTSTGQATGLTSTEFIVTTESPPTTTSTPLCDSGLMKAEDCRIFFCQDGQWQVGEFTATKECCLQTFHPKCQVMGFTTTEFTFTTIATTTRTPTCEFGSGRVQNCTVYLCENGEWQPFEFLASEECCLKVSHPMCIELGFTGEHTGFTSPVSSSSTGSPNADCSPDYSHVQDCGIYICENGQWQLFEFFASEECCEKEFHPRCEHTGFTSPGAELMTTPQDDRSPKDLPLTDSDYDSSEGELDVLLIRLPLFPVLPFPVAYRNGRPLNSHKEMSGDRHAEHRRK